MQDFEQKPEIWKQRLEKMCSGKNVYENSPRLTIKHRRPQAWEKTDRCHLTLPNLSEKHVQNLPMYSQTANDCITQREIAMMPYLISLEIWGLPCLEAASSGHAFTQTYTQTHLLPLLLTLQGQALAACPSIKPKRPICCSRSYRTVLQNIIQKWTSLLGKPTHHTIL